MPERRRGRVEGAGAVPEFRGAGEAGSEPGRAREVFPRDVGRRGGADGAVWIDGCAGRRLRDQGSEARGGCETEPEIEGEGEGDGSERGESVSRGVGASAWTSVRAGGCGVRDGLAGAHGRSGRSGSR